MHNPWVKAVDLQQWAQRADARVMLPAVIRRLIWATTQGKRAFSFPAGEGVQRPSWDGLLDVDTGNAWVPSGASAWEISNGNPPSTKALENFRKRTEQTSASDAAGLTFVFVTPLKWTGKSEWVEKHKPGTPWKNVRVLDSDDLEHWLEIAPPVDAWFARLLGKIPAGIFDLTSHWEGVSAITKPPLPAEAFLAGRESSREKIIEALSEPAREIRVAASSEQELVDFLSAAFGVSDDYETVASRIVVVCTRDAWRQMISSTEPLILTPCQGLMVDRKDIAQAVKAGHHVITRRPYTAGAEGEIIRLPRAWRYELEKALEKGGFSEEKSNRLAKESGGHLTVLQRLATADMGTQSPVWAEDPRPLVPFVLFGAWDDKVQPDQAVVSQFLGCDYEDALALASSWLEKSEPLFSRIGTEWSLVSREDSWVNLAGSLTRLQLEKFEKLAIEILSEDDPRFELPSDERAFAVLRKKIPQHSDTLREGLAETLALLGADLIPMPALPPGMASGCAQKVVRQLLSTDLSARRWFALSPILTLLAEAAPEEFLRAVEHDLSAPKPQLVELFSDDGGFFAGNRHHFLMWALASLAWHPDYLARVCLILASLAALDPGGKTHPRPGGLLHDIFRAWYPQTGATVSQRLQVLDLLVERVPYQAWELMLSLLPKGHDSAHINHPPPRWKEWPSAKRPRVTNRDLDGQERWVATRLVQLAEQNSRHLLALVEHIDCLLEDEFRRLVAHLLSADEAAIPSPARVELWECLNTLIRKHRFFTTAEWCMTDDKLAELDRVEVHLRPESPMLRGRWLFSAHHFFMGIHEETSYEKQEQMTQELRRHLISEIHSAGGVDAVVEFASMVRFPQFVGQVLGQIGYEDDIEKILPRYLDDDDPRRQTFAGSFAAAVFSRLEWPWIEQLPLAKWSSAAAAELLLMLPASARAWQIANSLGAKVESAFWSQACPYPGTLTQEQATEVLVQLLKHDRPLIAADYVTSAYYSKLTLPAHLLVETLERSIPALNEVCSQKTDVTMLTHYLADTLRYLQDAPDNDPAKVAQLEWAYLPLIKHSRTSPKYLFGELVKSPDLFADCVELIWKKDTPDADTHPPTENEKHQAELARELLSSWKAHPALHEEPPNEAVLREWIHGVRAKCEALGRTQSCDYEIGKLMSKSPAESDGTWPCVAARGVLESIPGEACLDSFRTGIFNNRGVTTRGAHDGGGQERDLAKKYHGFAEACQIKWPRVSATLRGIAEYYELDARFMDDQAESRR